MPRWYIDGRCLNCWDGDWKKPYRYEDAYLRVDRLRGREYSVEAAFYPKDGRNAVIGTWSERDALAGRFNLEGASDTSSTISYSLTTACERPASVAGTSLIGCGASTADSYVSTTGSNASTLGVDSDMWLI